MSKARKDHKRRVAARNQRLVAKAKSFNHEISEVEQALQDKPNLARILGIANKIKKLQKSINGQSGHNIIRKLTSMEKKETKQVNMNGQAPQPASAVQGAPEAVYKFTPEAYTALDLYLKTRPIREAKGLHTAFFRHNQVDPYYKQEAINRLIEYLTQCPLGEVEPLMDLLEKGGLLQFMPQPAPAAGEEKPQEQLPAESKPSEPETGEEKQEG